MEGAQQSRLSDFSFADWRFHCSVAPNAKTIIFLFVFNSTKTCGWGYAGAQRCNTDAHPLPLPEPLAKKN
jgi:hypothetical protein